MNRMAYNTDLSKRALVEHENYAGRVRDIGRFHEYIEALSSRLHFGSKIIPEMSYIFKKDAVVLSQKDSYGFLKEIYPDLDTSNSPKYIFDNHDMSQINKIYRKHKKDKTLIGIGGGKILDIMKYISMKDKSKKTITIPTSLKTHTYSSPCTHSPDTKMTLYGNPPDEMIVDSYLLEKAFEKNPDLIYSGIGDILSIATARNDWHRSAKGQDPFIESQLDELYECLNKVNPKEPLSKWMGDYIKSQIHLCYILKWGGSSPVSGTEHLFANAAEELGYSKEHAKLCGLGTIIGLHLQGRNHLRGGVEKILKKFNSPTTLEGLCLTKEQASNSLYHAKQWGKRKKRPTIIDSLNLTKKYCKKVIDEVFG